LARRSLVDSTVDLYPDRIDANIGIPSDALAPILQMLIAGRFKFVVMSPCFRRHTHAAVRSIRPDGEG